MAANNKISPLAPASSPELGEVAGVTLATAATGMRYKGRPDLLLMVFDPGTAISGCLTRSKSPSAPVDWCREYLPRGKARAIVVNAGNANAFTGRAGAEAVAACTMAASQALACDVEEIFAASTGVIGEPLDPAPIVNALPELAAAASGDGWNAAAEAIRTTDTYPKLATRTANFDGTPVTINGIAKGSGMIAPDMATMLAFVATDARLPTNILRKLVAQAVDKSFNCISVDSDTSTSDTVLMCATGRVDLSSEKALRSARDPRLADFVEALEDLCLDLALQVARDGEGAQKLISIRLTGAANDMAAKRIALTIANSPLVKTAIAGEDANWGRIVMAVGKAGERADRDRLQIRIGGIAVARDGARVPDYDEAQLVPHMKGREIDIEVDVGIGEGSAQVWTCDLTHDYIDINASYRS